MIVSSSTIHHVTNLEYLACQINRALTPGGHFFLTDHQRQVTQLVRKALLRT